ncbi:AMP-binding protein [Rhizobium sp. DKSPLA3]|uniref:AMP-binding protein n=1 Tax=Rhizobium quercicola TaxID=2901226 RepID=A0A9X1NQY9_9HYPH|nr:AMP-binding protein [Rhizobium quercicola]MCD7107796.1 AMP-binding protein [Rhizobium quercicola]
MPIERSFEPPRPWEAIHHALGVSAPAPETTPLGLRVSEAAARIPDHSALFFEGRRISYAELDRSANRLANALAARGVGKGDVIALHLPNTPQFVIGLVAASKLGAIASGVSTLLAPGELAFQLADSGAKVLLTLDTLAAARLAAIDRLPASLSTVVVTSAMEFFTSAPVDLPTLAVETVVSFTGLLEGCSADFRQVPVSGDDIFLLQYTGGTTGRPKGAMLSVAAVMTNPVTANIYEPYVYGAERMAAPFPFFHIGGVAGLIGALAAGGEFLVVLNPRDLEKFVDEVIRMRPTRLGAIPTFYQMLLNFPRSDEIDFNELKIAVTGGAPITGQDRQRLDHRLGAGKLSDCFGMTETSSVYVGNPPLRCKPAALGIPVPGADVRIVDVETGLQTLPPFERGEIITSGVHVMAGYWGMPEETAHALRPLDGKTWMYTGDVGYMDEEGYVYIADRAKDMLIVGGFKVFSLEVEDVVRRLPFVASAAAIGTPDLERAGNDIVNLVVQRNEAGRVQTEDALIEAIVRHCRHELAPYKIPKHVSFVDAIPLTSIGKIDKKALRATLGR